MAKSSTTPLLDKVRKPADVRKLKENQLRQLADELRLETIDAVSSTGGHLGKAAKELGISRTTLWRKMKKFGISAESVWND